MALASVDGDGESVSESNCSKEHLNADEEVLVAGADGARLGGDGAVVRLDGLDGARLLQDRQQEALPVGEEDDRLDGEELQDRLVGSQQVLGCDMSRLGSQLYIIYAIRS